MANVLSAPANVISEMIWCGFIAPWSVSRLWIVTSVTDPGPWWPAIGMPLMAERVTTANTNFAPKMAHPAFQSGAQLYWRVASLDEGNNLGAWVTNAIRQSKPMRLRVRGSLRKDRARRVRAIVKDSRGRAVRGAKVTVTGPGIRVAPRKTTRRGKVSFRLRPMVKGRVVFLAEKWGYAPASKRLSVR